MQPLDWHLILIESSQTMIENGADWQLKCYALFTPSSTISAADQC